MLRGRTAYRSRLRWVHADGDSGPSCSLSAKGVCIKDDSSGVDRVLDNVNRHCLPQSCHPGDIQIVRKQCGLERRFGICNVLVIPCR
jgi:hypothetical protein